MNMSQSHPVQDFTLHKRDSEKKNIPVKDKIHDSLNSIFIF